MTNLFLIKKIYLKLKNAVKEKLKSVISKFIPVLRLLSHFTGCNLSLNANTSKIPNRGKDNIILKENVMTA